MSKNNENIKYKYGSFGIGGDLSTPVPAPINPNDLGSISLSPEGDFEAGSFQTFELIYTAGKFGIDDSGSIRICFRFASDQSKPQFEDPKNFNYTSIKASNNAVLNYRFDPKGNVRPWDKTLYIKVVKGFLKEGDQIKILFGDKSKGSPGMRLQTFCEDTYEFHTLVDPIATFCYQPMLKQPVIKIIPGKPIRYVAFAPTLRDCNEKFTINFKGEDKWGNPSNQCDKTFFLKSTVQIKNMPTEITIKPGSFFIQITDLSVENECEFSVEFCNQGGDILFLTNTIKIQKSPSLKHYWGDLHGQSEETIGTGTAEQYFRFARDYAFLDVTAHQGNDFQMTKEFWKKLNELSKKYTVNNKFIIIPGYEWSGNTALGGDRNVFFPEEGRTIRRSSHAMISDHSDIENDCHNVSDLFKSFEKHKEFDVIGYAHCGGRYADINLAHDSRFEKSMEIHSSWGTFEWLVQDAFKLGLRTGIVANSDGHKGRPGASYPGASQFGAIGGLTCFLSKSLERKEILDSIRKRHHYATTGGPNGRIIIDVKAFFSEHGTLYNDDPRFINNEGILTNEAIMGDIVHLPKGGMNFEVNLSSNIPIERIELFNGIEQIETVRPFEEKELGSKIKIIWEGAEYRGRFREVIWDGIAKISDNKILDLKPINFFNPDKKLEKLSDNELKWKALTTGNLGGVEMIIKDPNAGKIAIDTPLIKEEILIKDIGIEDIIFYNNGVLPRFLKVFRLPNINKTKTFSFKKEIFLKENQDNPIFIKVTQQDGTISWTSPLYVYR